MSSNFYRSGTVPWPEISNHLYSKYNVLGIFDLCAYDADMSALYADLLKFQSRAFASNEKIVFYHFETDFYLNGTGFTVYNLQVILNALDISQSACIMLTLSYGIEEEIHSTGRCICNDSYPMQVVANSYVTLVSTSTPSLGVQNNFDQIEYPFSCLNGRERTHRVMLLCLLEELNLLDKGIVTWNFAVQQNPLQKEVRKNNNFTKVLLSTTPFVPINDRIFWSPKLKETYNQHYSKFIGQTSTHNDISLYSNFEEVGWFDLEPGFAKSFLYVSTETVFDYPNQLVSEKIFKSFINRRPFVVVGPPNTLKRLHELGFKTFDRIIDESYDTIIDPSERMLAVVNIISNISKKSVAELRDLANTIEDIIEYNYDYYCNHYCKTDLNRLLETL